MTDEEYMISQILLAEAESAQNDDSASTGPQVSLKSSSAKKNSKKKRMRNPKKDVPK